MKHTPGPWEARKYNDTKSTSIYAPGINHSIASVKKTEDGRLIAAAPELYEACEVLQDEDRLVEFANLVKQYPGESMITLFDEAFPEIKAVIAKAQSK